MSLCQTPRKYHQKEFQRRKKKRRRIVQGLQVGLNQGLAPVPHLIQDQDGVRGHDPGLIRQGGGLAQEGAHLLGEELHQGEFHLLLDTEGADLLSEGEDGHQHLCQEAVPPPPPLVPDLHQRNHRRELCPVLLVKPVGCLLLQVLLGEGTGPPHLQARPRNHAGLQHLNSPVVLENPVALFLPVEPQHLNTKVLKKGSLPHRHQKLEK